ncbi:D-arabinono-1,4-lactone oxidase [Nitriliruptor alkaliphilus]|uniref:D-arabinono-1,4-lactone oxidase n=1 Tax=Nitriliruptor alkaliphilus TaxID=427918 RepID=UPI000698B358|nr:D-arabinono-1,4-lactone oxidase [Nitriliruptor alkaliphilus]
MGHHWRNWSGNQRSSPARLVRPADEAAVVRTVTEAAARGGRVRTVGAGHSFTGLVATDDTLLDLAALHGVREVDPATGVATIGAGTTLAATSAQLADHGRAFENLGDIAVQTVAGATATATHGTGARFANLASTVVGLRLVAGDGRTVDIDAGRDPDLLRAARVHLGALGVVTEVRVRTVPAFTLEAEESVEAVDEVLADLDGFVDGNDHAEFFWFPGSEGRAHPHGLALVKRQQRSNAPPRPRGAVTAFVSDELISNVVYGAIVRASDHLPSATRAIHAVLGSMPASAYAERSDRVFASPRRVRFVEMEQSVPREAFPEAFARVRRVFADRGRYEPFPVECRWVAGDDADLSPAHGGPRAYLAVHLSPRRHDPRFFAAVEEALLPLGARPHWGKLHGRTAADLATSYPRWSAFQAARAHLDPTGTFANDHLDRVLGPVTSPVGRA